MTHKTSCEHNPFETVDTNIAGTICLIEAAIQHQIPTMTYISTHHDASPKTVMAATRLLAEHLLRSTQPANQKLKQRFFSIRIPNLLTSCGGLIPHMITHAQTRKEIPLPAGETTAFFMEISHATERILEATRIAKGKETFVLKSPALRIADLATKIEAHFSPQTIEHSALPESHECLMTEAKSQSALEFHTMYAILPEKDDPNERSEDYLPEQAKPCHPAPNLSKNQVLIEENLIQRLIEEFLITQNYPRSLNLNKTHTSTKL